MEKKFAIFGFAQGEFPEAGKENRMKFYFDTFEEAERYILENKAFIPKDEKLTFEIRPIYKP